MSTLDQEFEKWLPIVIPAFTPEQRDSRLATIRGFAKKVRISDVTALVLLFYDVRQGTLPQRMIDAAKESDLNLGLSDGADMAILAGGVLFEIMEKGGSCASTVALSLASAEFGGLKGTARVQAVVERAIQYLGDEGIRVREDEIKLPNLGETLRAALDDLGTTAETTPPKPAASDLEALDVVIGALDEYGTALQRAVRAIEQRRKEESNILYWLISGRRRVSDELLRGLKRQNVVLDIAFDLAAQTEQIPGPASSSVILRSLLEQCKDTTKESNVNNCIAAVSAEDGERLLSRSHTFDPRFMPLTFALEKAKENGWKTGWQTAFEAQTKMQVSAQRTLLEISEQFYRELLLARLLEKD